MTKLINAILVILCLLCTALQAAHPQGDLTKWNAEMKQIIANSPARSYHILDEARAKKRPKEAGFNSVYEAVWGYIRNPKK